ICVLHTAAGAFFRNYNLYIIDDLCASISEKDHKKAMEDAVRNYGAVIVKRSEVDRYAE
ncbi:MAG: isochorismatase family protein, partial [Thermoplasmataceae archaeon]